MISAVYNCLSGKLSTAALQWITRSSFDRDEKGIHVDGRFLSNLRFALEILLFSNSAVDEESVLADTIQAGKRAGLRVYRRKGHFMKNVYLLLGRRN